MVRSLGGPLHHTVYMSSSVSRAFDGEVSGGTITYTVYMSSSVSRAFGKFTARTTVLYWCECSDITASYAPRKMENLGYILYCEDRSILSL